MHDDVLRNRARVLAAVEALRAVATDNALVSEREGTLARPVVDALRDSCLLGLSAPTSLGGLECDPSVQLEVFEAAARIDTSLGWSLMISTTLAAIAGGYLSDEAAKLVFERGAPMLAGLLAPSGVAKPTRGGFIVNGRWGFGSGIHHAQWVVTSVVVTDDVAAGAHAAPGSRPPQLLSIVVPVTDVRIESTWDASMLRGSGSEHYRAEGLFVETAFTFAFPSAPAKRGGPLYDLPLLALLTPAHVGFALGAAAGALDAIVAAASKRIKTWTATALADSAIFHAELGRATAKLAAARAYAHQVLGKLWQRAQSAQNEEPLPIGDWGTIRMLSAYVTDVAAEVSTFAYRAGGGSAIYASSPLQRFFRDVHAATQHVVASPDAYEFAGRARLGHTAPQPLLVRAARV